MLDTIAILACLCVVICFIVYPLYLYAESRKWPQYVISKRWYAGEPLFVIEKRVRYLMFFWQYVDYTEKSNHVHDLELAPHSSSYMKALVKVKELLGMQDLGEDIIVGYVDRKLDIEILHTVSLFMLDQAKSIQVDEQGKLLIMLRNSYGIPVSYK